MCILRRFSCERYVKDKILKANHNAEKRLPSQLNVVSGMSKIKFQKQLPN